MQNDGIFIEVTTHPNDQNFHLVVKFCQGFVNILLCNKKQAIHSHFFNHEI